MNTYSQEIYEGKPLTFEQFLWRCALGQEPKSNYRWTLEGNSSFSYHDEAIKKSQARLDELRKMTLEEARAAARAEHARDTERRNEYLKEAYDRAARFRAVNYIAERWKPPTPEYENVKKRMLEVLKFDVRTDDEVGAGYPEFSCQTGEEWLETEKQQSVSNIAYHSKALQDIAKEVEKHNEWVKGLEKVVPFPY